jgi:hypothetical protein
MQSLPVQKRIELARALEFVKIIAAADMDRADENLRHGGAAVGASIIFTRNSRSRDTSISVNTTFFFFRSAFASMQNGQYGVV